MPDSPALCAACQFANPPGARFCAGCGQRLALRCGQCGQPLVAGGRFCPGCGAPAKEAEGEPSDAAGPGSAPEASVSISAVTAASSPATGVPALAPDIAAARAAGASPPAVAERRLVTILFADIVGSTSLGEAIDPEDLAELINGGFEVMTRAVHDAGGYIARLMGDGLLAFFGAPVSHEDDPLRAVRAGLAIRDGVVAYGQRVAAGGGPLLGVRVGLDSGLVVVGQVGSDLFSEYTTLGDAPNTAARLQGAAPPNEVLLSAATERLIRGAVAVEPFGLLELKGKSEPVPAFRVTGPPPEPGLVVRGLPGVTTPLVGREGELARLLGLFEDAVAGRRVAWVTVASDAGVGKSRLLAAVLENLAQRHESLTLLRARAVEQDTGAPYSLLRNLLVGRYGEEEGGLAAARAAVREGLLRDLADAPGVAGMAGVAGVPALAPESAAGDLARLVLPDAGADADPRGRAERGLAALVAVVRRLAQRSPLVLALEDLHWADDASLDALARVANALANEPALLLGNSRPELFARRPFWGEGEAGHVRLDLAPLSPAATGRLVAALLEGDDPVPDEVADFVLERSEGNPYYVEELVRMLLAREILVRGADGWRVEAAALEEGRVPTTLQGMLQARLDHLAAAEKDALQRASVLGRVFWTGALTALGVADLSVVDTLRGRGLVYARERSTFPGERELIFKHALLRDAAYASMLKKVRPAYHSAAADWLQAVAGDHYADLASQIAHHCLAAGRQPDAARHYLAAGERALAGYANAGAVDLFSRALDLLPPKETAQRFAGLKGRELALDMLGRREEQARDLDEMAELAARLPQGATSYVHFRRSWMADRTGDAAAAEAEALAAVDTAGDDAAARADGLVNLGNALLVLERSPEARGHFEEARTLREGLGDIRGAAIATLGAANAAEQMGDPEVAIRSYQDALTTFRQIDDLGLQAKTLTNLAVSLAVQGQLDAAAPQFDAALHLYRAAGDRAGEGKALGNLGYLATQLGDFDSAETRCLSSIEILRSVGNVTSELEVLQTLAELYAAHGRRRDAARTGKRIKVLQAQS